MSPLLLLWGAAQAACPGFSPGPRDAGFAATRPPPGQLVVEVRVERADDGEALAALLAPMSARGLPATVVVAPDVAAALSAELRQAARDGHEVGVLLRAAPRGPLTANTYEAFSGWWREIRAGRRDVRRATRSRVRVVALSPLTDPAELAVEQSGVQALLPLTPMLEASRPVRTGGSFGGRARVVTDGPYPDRCGAPLPAWTPAALDRAARSAPSGDPGRVVLPLDGARPELLAAWLDEVVLPARGVRVKSASRVVLRTRPKPAAAPKAAAPAGRLVTRAEWLTAARAIAAPGRLPRTPAPGLNLTEAFLALLAVAAAEAPPEAVRLDPALPPLDVPSTRLAPDGVTLDADELRALARSWRGALGQRLPASAAVSGHSLTTGEVLRALALLALDQPLVVTPAPPPDPFAEGAGWGASGER